MRQIHAPSLEPTRPSRPRGVKAPTGPDSHRSGYSPRAGLSLCVAFGSFAACSQPGAPSGTDAHALSPADGTSLGIDALNGGADGSGPIDQDAGIDGVTFANDASPQDGSAGVDTGVPANDGAIVPPPPPSTSIDSLTFHGDSARTGWYRNERQLTPINVRPATFGRVAISHDVQGEITGQPLFASGISVMDQRTRTTANSDVVFVATMADRVYALTPDTLDVLWHFDFEGRSAPLASDLQSCQSPYHIGVMSTPVISPDRSVLYAVGRVIGTSPTDTWLQGYALSTRDGSILARFRVGEVLGADGVTRTPYTYSGYDNGVPITVPFTTNMYTQRSALLLAGNMLYVSVGGICDVPGFRGWLMAFDVRTLSEHAAPTALWMGSPSGGGGMWAPGGAASDGTSVFVAVGNGRSAIRAGTPASNRSIADALVRFDPVLDLDSTACFSVSSPTAPCGSADATNLRNVFMPRNAELLARSSIADTGPDIADPDEDFGSAAPMLIPSAELPENAGIDGDRRLAAVGGKDGFFYLVDRDRMGGIGPSQLAADSDIPNLIGAELYGRELYFHGDGSGIYSTATYFEGHTGRYLYIMGAAPIPGRTDSPQGLAALRLRSVTDPTPADCAAQFRQITYGSMSLPCATIWGSAPRPGFELAWSSAGPTAGGSPVVSSNGHSDAIVWVTFERAATGYGLLQAFAAEESGTGLVATPIYSSDTVAADRLPSTVPTYGSPVVANGRVYVVGPGYVAAFGLLPARAAP